MSHTTTDRPRPTDFDNFLPWVCKDYDVDADIIINRVLQKPYVKVATAMPERKLSKKSSLKTKTIKESFSVSSCSNSDTVDYSSLLKKNEFSNESKVMIETIYNTDDDLVALKFLKNKIIPRKVMQVIALTLPYQKYLASITINRGLRMDTLYEISKFLPNSQITELCFDGTFINEANYHILLTQNKLKHLSLARCTINDTVVKTITDKLKEPSPAAKILSALNLSNNKITDIGAKYIADMLRTNRQLCYLNLAGNMITDEGGVSILDTLQKFPLQLSEVLKGRAGYVAYMKKRNNLIQALIKDLEAATCNNTNKKISIKKGSILDTLQKFQSQSQELQEKEKEALINKFTEELQATSVKNAAKKKTMKKCKLVISQSIIDTQNIQNMAQFMADKKLGVYNEPFSPDNTEMQDGVVYCLGNNTLYCLNLAYNNLSYLSLKKLLEVLKMQKHFNRIPRGLIKVVIEGNLMPVACEEFKEIDRLLESFTSCKRKKTESILKKKLLPTKHGKSTK